MTEVLSAHEMDFSPRQSTMVNVDSDELLRSNTPLVIRSPFNDLGRSSLPDRHLQQHDICDSTHSQRGHVELSVLALVLAAFKRTGFTCQGPPDDIKMDIGWPTNVRHVAHVTFDRFNGFLGLPAEFQMEVPRRVPSASASVFGVSPESMQCSYDRRGNSVPTILLLLQERLYDQGGLKAEGVFRINAENSQEEHVRDQLNRGIVPYDIDVHCLAGLIKAWFRELPKGILDSLSPEQVMQCHTEEQTLALVKTLPPTEAALLDWGVNLMADVVLEEYFNKMNAHNIAMVFAPNMTQMADPLTALMHAVQVMNFLKTLILKTLRERAEASLDPRPASSCSEPPTGNGRDDAPEEVYVGGSNTNDTSDMHAAQTEAFFLRAFNKGQSIVGEYEPARNSEELFLRELNASEEDELSSECQGPSSNDSSTMDNTDDDNTGTPSFVFKRAKDEPLCLYSDGDLAGSSAEASPCGDDKPELFSNIFGRMENLNLEGEDYVVTEFLQCNGLHSVPGKPKAKEGCVVGKIDQLVERVEAW